MIRTMGQFRRAKATSAAVMALLVVGSSFPALAQDTQAEARLRKVEAEVRALQRKVFPGGDEKFFPPQITSSNAPNAPPGTASTSAVTDLLSRMDALEAQIARLTGQIEENGNRIAKLESYHGAGAAATGTPAGAATSAPTPAPAPAAEANLSAMTGGASAKPETKPAAAPANPPSERVAAVSAIVKPQTDDAGDDEYSYGYRLWEAKFYPEAQQQLKMFVDKYPRHRRASWGRNLLGRAYLDEGNPREAAKWFLQNYQAEKNGGRAPDSLLYLAVAMKQLKDTKRSCIALAEFSETYASEAAGRLKGLYDATRSGLNCNG